MKYHIIDTDSAEVTPGSRIDSLHRAAVVIFAGWGMDCHPFEALHFSGRTLIVVYDYADTSADPLGDELASWLAGNFTDICLIGWSFGVYHASVWLERNGDRIPVTLRIAVNGTSTPVDSSYGIPPSMVTATLRALSEQSLQKFRLRMCGSRQAFAQFMTSPPQRSLESLSCELKQIIHTQGCKPRHHLWDIAYISSDDRIFPYPAQLRAWESSPAEIIVIPDGNHLPDWHTLQTSVNERLIDKTAVAKRFAHAASTYNANATVQRTVALRLASQLPQLLCGTVIEIGAGTGILSEILRRKLSSDATLRLWDIAPVFEGVEKADAECAIRLLEAESVDIIAGSSVMQWFQAPGAFLRHCFRVLKPGGIAAFSVFGPLTYSELTSLTRRLPTYRSADQWRKLALDVGWESVEVSEAIERLTFDTPLQVLRHMRLTGVNAVTTGSEAVKSARNILSRYPVDSEGRCPLTYNPIYLILRK